MGVQWNSFIGGSLVCVCMNEMQDFESLGCSIIFLTNWEFREKEGGQDEEAKWKKRKNSAKRIDAYILVSELLGNKCRVKRGISGKKNCNFIA